MAKANLTAQHLRELLHYDPETGVFTWRNAIKCSGGVRPAGSIAGSFVKKGYIEIGVIKSVYYAHRLAWLYVTGDWPKGQIDHLNRSKRDNRFANLRDVSGSTNQHNRSLTAGASGFVGVHKTRSGKWSAKIKIARALVYLGTFSSPEEATAARNDVLIQHGLPIPTRIATSAPDT